MGIHTYSIRKLETSNYCINHYRINWVNQASEEFSKVNQKWNYGTVYVVRYHHIFTFSGDYTDISSIIWRDLMIKR